MHIFYHTLLIDAVVGVAIKNVETIINHIIFEIRF